MIIQIAYLNTLKILKVILIELKNSFNNIVDKINDVNLKSVKGSEFFNSVSLDDFKENFDKMLLQKSSSIGWVESIFH